MSSLVPPPPPREQLCNRHCSNKHTHSPDVELTHCTALFLTHSPFPWTMDQKKMTTLWHTTKIQDGFIHYQRIRFCQVTRLQYVNCHVQLDNQDLLQHSTAQISQQQHSQHSCLAQAEELCQRRRKTTASARSVSSSQDQQPTRPCDRPSQIPSQLSLTQQLSRHWPQFKVLSHRYTGTCFEEQ